MAEKSEGRKKKVIMVSSLTAPCFMKEYLKTKREAERYLTEREESFNTTIIRPGLIWHFKERPWSMMFLAQLNPIYAKIYTSILNKENIDNINPLLSVLMLPLPTHLDSILHFAIESIKED